MKEEAYPPGFGGFAAMDIECVKHIYKDFATVTDYPRSCDSLSNACLELMDAGFDVRGFKDYLDPYILKDLQAAFYETFGLCERIGPYAAYYAYEKECDRYDFMSKLEGFYADCGCQPENGGFPDYIPQMLRFLGGDGFYTARALLPALVSAADKIAQMTAQRESRYHCVYKALRDFASLRLKAGADVLNLDI